MVLPFSWRQDGRSHEGVFKALKPGIGERLAEELPSCPRSATSSNAGAEFGLPAIDYRSHLAAASRLLVQEIRLDREQANLPRAAWRCSPPTPTSSCRRCCPGARPR